MSESNDGVTDLLARVASGDREAWNEVFPSVYGTLREIARRLMRDQAPGHVLQTTALVHEAFLKLTGKTATLETRRHFERVAARAMRQVLVDHARARNAAKRTGGHERELLTEEIGQVSGPRIDVLALHEAIEKLTVLDPAVAEITELHCFGGLEHDEVARVTDRSKRTVERMWRFAKSWLERELEASDE